MNTKPTSKRLKNEKTSAAQSDSSFLVRIDSGLVRGHLHKGTEPTPEFMGIPYAATTGGENRYRAPQPRKPWGDEVWVADTPGPDCINNEQGDGIFGGVIAEPRKTGEMVGDTYHQAEDSLFMNIWTPALDKEKRPVMVWIHGGGLRTDSSNRPCYVGNHLAHRGNVVVVAINYRLGGVGMMTHPALRDPESGYMGNWNLLDMLFALQWIQRNIHAFGGNKNNVTIFGESGGSVGVNDLAIIDKKIRGNLFHRVIGQSGDPILSPLEQHIQVAEKSFEFFGCKPENALVHIRQLSLEKFKKVADGWSSQRLFPTSDGKLIPSKSVYEAIRAGETEGLDWIIGANGPGWDVGTEASWRSLLEHSKKGGRAYRYYLPDSPGVRGNHGTDIPLVFGTYEDNLGTLTERQGDRGGLVSRDNPNVPKLSARMIKSWTNFAWTGDPSFEDEELGKVRWETYKEDSLQTIVWDDKPHLERREPVTDANVRARPQR